MENATSRVTKDQIEHLVQIMEKNPKVAKGVCTNPALFWQEVSVELNCLGPAKDKNSWKKTWTDKKSNVKKKYSLMRREQLKTGGGIPEAIFLSEIEERILNVTNTRANVDGVKDSVCIGAPEHLNKQPAQLQPDPVASCSSVEQDPVPSCSSVVQEFVPSCSSLVEPVPCPETIKTNSAKPSQNTAKPSQNSAKPSHNITKLTELEKNQTKLIQQNEMIADSLAELVTAFKIYAESTMNFTESS
ncbi:uncharacterized protein LOC125769421 [Anopheles funestus]|uniref:uncharacterized protein LOC125769421 n=1 Tax=Anopheles funestus TaxID=62324 RepID=UPI0020C687F6|nr:uncharacterized protein LOC125769421 [Anopheles funestus]